MTGHLFKNTLFSLHIYFAFLIKWDGCHFASTTIQKSKQIFLYYYIFEFKFNKKIKLVLQQHAAVWVISLEPLWYFS